MEREYLVVLPIDPMPIGEIYGSDQPPPLHCTLMHWFILDDVNQRRLGNKLESFASSVAKGHIELISKEPALFGPNNDVPVHVLERNEELNLIHTKLLMYLFHVGARFTELCWVGAGYRPHVTTTGGVAFKPGRIHLASRLTLVKRKEDGSKVVVQESIFGTPELAQLSK